MHAAGHGAGHVERTRRSPKLLQTLQASMASGVASISIGLCLRDGALAELCCTTLLAPPFAFPPGCVCSSGLVGGWH